LEKHQTTINQQLPTLRVMIVYQVKCATEKAIAYDFILQEIMGKTKFNLANFVETLQMFW
jgi:hypothetical protein